jgi:hypothetical protein
MKTKEQKNTLGNYYDFLFEWVKYAARIPVKMKSRVFEKWIDNRIDMFAAVTNLGDEITIDDLAQYFNHLN